MEAKDFTVFSTLFSLVYAKAFGEEISKLPYGKALSLSWMIYDTTGEMLSYKSLTSYAKAILMNKPDMVNPTNSTLGVLVRFVDANTTTPGKKNQELPIFWYQFRSQAFRLSAVGA